MTRLIIILFVAGVAAAGWQFTKPRSEKESAPTEPSLEDSSADNVITESSTAAEPPLTEYQARLFSHVPGLLFFLDRNTNANVVVYTGVTNGGEWVAPEVESEWVMLEKLGDKTQVEQAAREAVTAFEQQAYGFSSSNGPSQGTKQFTLTPVPDLPIQLEYSEALGRPIARMNINGTDARLVQISVFATAFLGIPSVKHVDLFGYAMDSNEPVTQRIQN